MIIKKINTASESDIYNCLLACNKNFIPILSERVDLNEYSRKIYHNATNFEAWHYLELIGLISVYFNDFDGIKSGYITNVCFIEKYQGNGFAKELMKLCKQYAIENQIEKLILEVFKENLAAIHFYQKQNFKVIKNDNNFLLMQLNMLSDV